ncbi:MAG: secretin N-terminal domain-containing protein [Candidatus Hinthialibacter antarcticus]|nr:secretin N-terminal domain-containing protein [Candidatus Hinthialibacter antarcticus]
MKAATLSLMLTTLLFIQQTSFAQEEAPKPTPNGDNEILLNFRGASLDAVLDYLSEIAGFVIVKQTDVSGQIDVWSRQPLSQDEAINLLNTVLHEKGYAAIRNGRILTIVDRDDAIKKDIPVKTGNNPDLVPKTDEMITQIIPVRYTDALALIDNLSPLLADYATMTANESSNAVIITDTQANIHRMMAIIRALDTSISGISAINVYPLQYTDAAELADIVNQLFEVEDSDNNRGRGGGGPGGFFGRGGPRGGDEEQSDSEARKAASRVVAVADENTNALIVSAPEEYMATISELIRQVDTAVSDLTEIQVFRLEYADAYEMAEQIEELFPDDSSQDQNAAAPRFGPGAFFGRGGGGPQQSQQDNSERQLQQATVRSVADPRTNSVVVFAAQETMQQIEQMIKRLDSDTSKKQRVFVYRLEFADVDNVAEILRNIFESQNTNINRTADTNQNTLSNRSVNLDTGATQRFN